MVLLAVASTLLMFASSLSAADATSPKTVIHVITVQWKPDATADQIANVLSVVASLPGQDSGIIRVWTKPIKKQIPEGYNHIIVMEFSSEDALKKYVDSPAQKKFYEVYMPLRAESKTSDISN